MTTLSTLITIPANNLARVPNLESPAQQVLGRQRKYLNCYTSNLLTESVVSTNNMNPNRRGSSRTPQTVGRSRCFAYPRGLLTFITYDFRKSWFRRPFCHPMTRGFILRFTCCRPDLTIYAHASLGAINGRPYDDGLRPTANGTTTTGGSMSTTNNGAGPSRATTPARTGDALNRDVR